MGSKKFFTSVGWRTSRKPLLSSDSACSRPSSIVTFFASCEPLERRRMLFGPKVSFTSFSPVSTVYMMSATGMGHVTLPARGEESGTQRLPGSGGARGRGRRRFACAGEEGDERARLGRPPLPRAYRQDRRVPALRELLPDDQWPGVLVRRRADERLPRDCLLYTSDAADERSSVDLGGRRIIKKKKKKKK